MQLKNSDVSTPRGLAWGFPPGRWPLSNQVGFGRGIVTAVVPTVFVALPSLLVGTLGVQLRSDLGISLFALGGAIAISRGSGALSSVYLGYIAERLGSERGLRIGVILTTLILLGIGLVVSGWWLLMLLLAGEGLMRALARPAADLWLVRRIEPRRLGFAFGFQNAVPDAAALLAGLAVPIFATTIGWRGAFVAAAGLAAASLWVIPRAAAADPIAKRADRSGDLPVGPMTVLSVGLGMGIAAGSSLVSFLVLSLVDAGVSETTAGLLFAISAAVGLATRLMLGTWADRRPGAELSIVTWMLTLAAGAFVVLGSGHGGWMMAIAPITFPVAWGWTGLFSLWIVRENPKAPGVGTAITRTGGFLGGIVGPLGFGYLAQNSYGAAWLLTAGWAAAAALAMIAARKMVLQVPRKLER